MTKVRNLTQEAIDKAKSQMLARYPQLADSYFRINLDPLTKGQVIVELLDLQSYYEQEFIEEIKYGRTNKKSGGQTNEV